MLTYRFIQDLPFAVRSRKQILVLDRSTEDRHKTNIAGKRKDAGMVCKQYCSIDTMVAGLLFLLTISVATAAGPTAAQCGQMPAWQRRFADRELGEAYETGYKSIFPLE
jgi:hypothetical protein